MVYEQPTIFTFCLLKYFVVKYFSLQKNKRLAFYVASQKESDLYFFLYFR